MQKQRTRSARVASCKERTLSGVVAAVTLNRATPGNSHSLAYHDTTRFPPLHNAFQRMESSILPLPNAHLPASRVPVLPKDGKIGLIVSGRNGSL
jgi:hypothetical protein